MLNQLLKRSILIETDGEDYSVIFSGTTLKESYLLLKFIVSELEDENTHFFDDLQVTDEFGNSLKAKDAKKIIASLKREMNL